MDEVIALIFSSILLQMLWEFLVVTRFFQVCYTSVTFSMINGEVFAPLCSWSWDPLSGSVWFVTSLIRLTLTVSILCYICIVFFFYFVILMLIALKCRDVIGKEKPSVSCVWLAFVTVWYIFWKKALDSQNRTPFRNCIICPFFFFFYIYK